MTHTKYARARDFNDRGRGRLHVQAYRFDLEFRRLKQSEIANPHWRVQLRALEARIARRIRQPTTDANRTLNYQLARLLARTYQFSH